MQALEQRQTLEQRAIGLVDSERSIFERFVSRNPDFARIGVLSTR